MVVTGFFVLCQWHEIYCHDADIMVSSHLSSTNAASSGEFSDTYFQLTHTAI